MLSTLLISFWRLLEEHVLVAGSSGSFSVMRGTTKPDLPNLLRD